MLLGPERAVVIFFGRNQLGDLHRVDVEFLDYFLDGFDALDRLKRQRGLRSS